MSDELERHVRRRARYRCEYCRMPQAASKARHPIDHVISRQHRGETTADNLALACLRCNGHKGPNIAGLDPITGSLTPLYHPRRDRWADHFAWQGPILDGLTAVGRTTIHVLSINTEPAVAARQALIDAGEFPRR